MKHNKNIHLGTQVKVIAQGHLDYGKIGIVEYISCPYLNIGKTNYIINLPNQPWSPFLNEDEIEPLNSNHQSIFYLPF